MSFFLFVLFFFTAEIMFEHFGVAKKYFVDSWGMNYREKGDIAGEDKKKEKTRGAEHLRLAG